MEWAVASGLNRPKVGPNARRPIADVASEEEEGSAIVAEGLIAVCTSGQHVRQAPPPPPPPHLELRHGHAAFAASAQRVCFRLGCQMLTGSASPSTYALRKNTCYVPTHSSTSACVRVQLAFVAHARRCTYAGQRVTSAPARTRSLPNDKSPA